MIIGLTGAICSGKRTFAKYLQVQKGFHRVDLIYLFCRFVRDPSFSEGISPIRKKEQYKASQVEEEDTRSDSLDSSFDQIGSFDLSSLAPEDGYEEQKIEF